MFVQAFITEPVVEALEESVLNGLPRFDEVQPHIVAVGPFVDCLDLLFNGFDDKLRTIV